MTESGELGFSRQDILVITACAISMLIVQMDWFALNLAIPAIAKHFNVASTDLQWVVSGYMLSIGALMVTAGRLADIFGRRLGLAWALTQVATQAVVPAEYAGAASGDFVRVACRGRRRDRCGCVRARRGLSRSCAERCTRACNVILLAGALLAFVGAVGLMMFGRPRATARDTR